MMMIMMKLMMMMMMNMMKMMMMMMQTFGRSPRPNKQSIIQVLPKISTGRENTNICTMYKYVHTNTLTIQIQMSQFFPNSVQGP